MCSSRDDGADLAAEAIKLALVDELRMFRNPVLVGGGTSLLPAVPDDVPLDLIETTTFGSRVIYERYRRANRRSSGAQEQHPGPRHECRQSI